MYILLAFSFSVSSLLNDLSKCFSYLPKKVGAAAADALGRVPALRRVHAGRPKDSPIRHTARMEWMACVAGRESPPRKPGKEEGQAGRKKSGSPGEREGRSRGRERYGRLCSMKKIEYSRSCRN